MEITLEDALATNIAIRIDEKTVSKLLSRPPWIQIDGVYNVRDIGSRAVRNGFVYRSGLIGCMTDQGKKDIQLLGIKKIFDLRSAKEIENFPDPVIDGVEVVGAATTAMTTPADSGKYPSLPQMYMDMLISHQKAWKVILEHIRDHENQPFLFHCTGEKDRTGIAAAIVLSIAGESKEAICHDFALSRIGIEPASEILTKKLTGGRTIDMQSQSYQRIAMISANVMDEFLGEVEKKYDGSLSEYAEDVLGFSGKDLETIRKNLI